MKGLTFVPEMAVAALSGRKTVTRRVIVPQPVYVASAMGPMRRVEHGPVGHYFFSDTMAPDIVRSLCDYKAGERRCLLTTWAVYPGYDDRKPSELPFSNFDARLDRRINAPDRIWHAGMGDKPDWCGKSRPGRFLPDGLRGTMPMFDIVSVRAERVQEITEEDAEAEGVDEFLGEPQLECDEQVRHYPDASFVRTFRTLWNSINADRGYAWDANPWVWRVEFRRVAA